MSKRAEAIMMFEYEVYDLMDESELKMNPLEVVSEVSRMLGDIELTPEEKVYLYANVICKLHDHINYE